MHPDVTAPAFLASDGAEAYQNRYTGRDPNEDCPDDRGEICHFCGKVIPLFRFVREPVTGIITYKRL